MIAVWIVLGVVLGYAVGSATVITAMVRDPNDHHRWSWRDTRVLVVAATLWPLFIYDVLLGKA